jgi:hypothetical protein
VILYELVESPLARCVRYWVLADTSFPLAKELSSLTRKRATCWVKIQLSPS